MREFSSYGPVDPEQHFCVPRTELLENCVRQMIGDPDKGGHFFTMWAPRQTGKTWIMRRARDEIRARCGDRLLVTVLTLQEVMKAGDPDEVFFRNIPGRLKEALGVAPPPLSSFEDWRRLFEKDGGLFDRPTVLLIDEFDSLSPSVIGSLVAIFRQIYLTRQAYHLHGLALIGVRAVLGMDNQRGSPFNVQRSLHVPNLTLAEVRDLYRQYQEESAQTIAADVVDRIYEVTRGQPGLVSWFGELLTQKYNPDRTRPITLIQWERVYTAACHVEPNNTVLNVLSKARDEYVEQVKALFTKSDVVFSYDLPWCNYLYLNGVIDHEEVEREGGRILPLCRFSSPFIQLRLYHAFSADLLRERVPVVNVLDEMSDVFTAEGLSVPALLRRYREYLARLREAGIDPWRDQPRRADLHMTEAVGHFHLYAWLREVVGDQCVITPEFPTGNGKVDLVLRYEGQLSLIEIKSLTRRSLLKAHRRQAAGYAKKKGLTAAVLAVFVPVHDDAALVELSSVEIVDGVQITIMAFG